MQMMQRLFQHLCVMPWRVRQIFSRPVRARIEASIAALEQGRQGEIRFVVEASLDWSELWRGVTARQRAVELFSRLRMWDTEHNSGVLVYALFAERRLEIVADRGISARVSQAEWEAICTHMGQAFHEGRFEAGTLEGLQRIEALLATHFPATAGTNPDELSNRVIVL